MDPRVEIVAFAAFDAQSEVELRRIAPHAERCASLEELVQCPEIQLVSLCSPLRSEQAQHAMTALQAGKHVYAEKPCALSESDLDRLHQESVKSGCVFHEMASTAFEQPYWALGRQMREGVIGEIVQIYTQKSYPLHDGRPRDEAVDGGLLCQVGVHAVRYIEHLTGLKVSEIHCRETQVGLVNPLGLRHAANLSLTLENGALAVAAINYCNQRGFGSWGNETVRIWGTKGMIEAADGGKSTRLVIGERDCGPVPGIAESAPDFFGSMVSEIMDGTPPFLSLSDELDPTRIVLRAKKQAQLAGAVNASGR